VLGYIIVMGVIFLARWKMSLLSVLSFWPCEHYVILWPWPWPFDLESTQSVTCDKVTFPSSLIFCNFLFLSYFALQPQKWQT